MSQIERVLNHYFIDPSLQQEMLLFKGELWTEYWCSNNDLSVQAYVRWLEQELTETRKKESVSKAFNLIYFALTFLLMATCAALL